MRFEYGRQNIGKAEFAAARELQSAVLVGNGFHGIGDKAVGIRSKLQIAESERQGCTELVGKHGKVKRLELVENIKRNAYRLRVGQRNLHNLIVFGNVFHRLVAVGRRSDLISRVFEYLIDKLGLDVNTDKAVLQYEFGKGDLCVRIGGGKYRRAHSVIRSRAQGRQHTHNGVKAEQLNLGQSEAGQIGVNRGVVFELIQSENLLIVLTADIGLD